MTTKTDEQERRDFECFMSDDGKFPQAIERDANGNYVLMQAASSWHVWQARAALQSQDRDAERYRLLRQKVAIAGEQNGASFHIINLRPTYVAPDAGIELDAAIDHARRIDKETL